jgi:biopolymer transport protein ExbD
VPLTRLRRRGLDEIPFDHGQPFSALNAAPIAGVILVAWFLVLMSYGNPTHIILVDLPPTLHPNGPRDLTKQVNYLRVTDTNQRLWNGEAIGVADLVSNLDATLHQPREPELVFEPDAHASYDLSLHVLAVISGSGVTKFCFGGLAENQHFEEPYRGKPLVPAEGNCDPYLDWSLE